MFLSLCEDYKISTPRRGLRLDSAPIPFIMLHFGIESVMVTSLAIVEMIDLYDPKNVASFYCYVIFQK